LLSTTLLTTLLLLAGLLLSALLTTLLLLAGLLLSALLATLLLLAGLLAGILILIHLISSPTLVRSASIKLRPRRKKQRANNRFVPVPFLVGWQIEFGTPTPSGVFLLATRRNRRWDDTCCCGCSECQFRFSC
jgi:hypothetical protein